MPDVDVVVCTHNNRWIVARTLDAILGQTLQPRSCTVVDGCSSDGTPEFVEANYPGIRVIRKTTDSGPAHSRNVGLAAGAAEYVAFVDSDVALLPDWLEQQVDLMLADADVAMASGKLVYAAHPEILHASYGAINRIGVAWEGGLGMPADSFTALKRCVWVVTAAVMTRRSIFDRIGGFDECMFAAYEDVDWGWRASVSGFRIVSNPHAVASHLVNETLDPDRMHATLLHLVWRNRIRFMVVNYELGSLACYLSTHLIFAFGLTVFSAPRLPKLRALWWNMRHLPDTLRRRRTVQALRTTPDRALRGLFDRGVRGPGYGALRARTRSRAERGFAPSKPAKEAP